MSEQKYADASALHKRLLTFNEEEAQEVTIILLLSLPALSEELPWFYVFFTLACAMTPCMHAKKNSIWGESIQEHVFRGQRSAVHGHFMQQFAC